jgi:hypothetical protein
VESRRVEGSFELIYIETLHIFRKYLEIAEYDTDACLHCHVIKKGTRMFKVILGIIRDKART